MLKVSIYRLLLVRKTIPGSQDFVEAIKRLVTPSRGRKLIVEVLTGALNFKVYLENLDVVITGLTPNPRGAQPQMHTNHCWRFVRRMDSCLFDTDIFCSLALLPRNVRHPCFDIDIMYVNLIVYIKIKI